MKNIILFTFLIITTIGFSQELVSVKITDEKVANFAKEVYHDVLEYQNEELLQAYKETLNRFEIIKATDAFIQAGNYSLISTLDLMNKYNPDLEYDKGPDFDVENFNLLKYFFPTAKDGSSEYYRIYKTNYLVRLLPRK